MEEPKKRVGRPTRNYECIDCGEIDIENFYTYKKNRCKRCQYTKTKKWDTENILRTRVLAAKHRALRKGMIFELTDECIEKKLIEQEGKCYISKIPLSLLPDGWDTISFDRLNNDLGYTIENTILVVKFVNTSKNSMDIETFNKYIEDVYNGIKGIL